jgi:uncharacterized protein YkwD
MSRGFTIATALAVLFTCMLGGAAPASAKKRGCARTSAAPVATTLPQAYEAVLCLINQQRARHGLHALRNSAQLTQAAVGHSTDMVARQYFAHEGLDGMTPRQRVLRSGYFGGGGAGGTVEEALACGWMQLATPRALVSMLMADAEHRNILLNPGLRDVGVGLVLGGPQDIGAGGATLTLDLARR